MNMETHTIGANSQHVVYKGAAQSQLFTPEFQIHEMVGGSISSPLHEMAQSEPFRLSIDEHLLVGNPAQHWTEKSDRTLAERVGEAYKYDLEPEETDFLNHAAEQFGRRLSSEE